MLDLDTFLTTLYVMADDYCQDHKEHSKKEPGPQPALEEGEMITLMILQQHWRFRSERDFYRFAQSHLKGYFPKLPVLSQYNRQARKMWRRLIAFWQHLVDRLQGQNSYEVLDTVPIPVRNIKRRGRGWLAGMANVGWSTRLGWYNGFHGLVSVNSIGVITGYAFGKASEKDQPLASAFFQLRLENSDCLPCVGRYSPRYYLADNGFKGHEAFQFWRQQCGATVIVAPPRFSNPWPKSWKFWFTSLRQIVETVYDKLENFFGLGSDRCHDLSGFHFRFAAKAALHNFFIFLNCSAGRPPLAFADLLSW
jgi:hypothetical protein